MKRAPGQDVLAFGTARARLWPAPGCSGLGCASDGTAWRRRSTVCGFGPDEAEGKHEEVPDVRQGVVVRSDDRVLFSCAACGSASEDGSPGQTASGGVLGSGGSPPGSGGDPSGGAGGDEPETGGIGGAGGVPGSGGSPPGSGGDSSGGAGGDEPETGGIGGEGGAGPALNSCLHYAIADSLCGANHGIPGRMLACRYPYVMPAEDCVLVDADGVDDWYCCPQ